MFNYSDGDNFQVKLRLATVTSYTDCGKSGPTKMQYQWYGSESGKVKFRDSWIYLEHRKTLFTDTIGNRIYFCINANGETQKIIVDYTIDAVF